MEYANPVEEMAVMLRISPIGRGIGGLKNKEAVSAEYRNVHESYLGNIDPLDTPEGSQIGVVQQLTLDAEISSVRGIFNLKEMGSDQGSGILSTSSALIPFTSCNDGNRIMFACSQQKQMLPLKNPEPPAVMTGYESILTNILSPNFVKKSPVDGKIIEISKSKISIDSKDGQRYSIDLSPIHLSSGSGRDTLSIFTPKVSINQKVREKQIIAEGSSIKDGTISLGRNLLVAYMPYKGYSFDDGIIISEKLVKNEKLVSLHAIIEEVLISEKDRILYVIESGTRTEKGDILLRKSIGEIEELLGFDEDESSVLYGQEMIKKSPGGVVVDIEVFSNIDLSKNLKLKELNERTREKYGAAPKEKFLINGKSIKGILIKFKIQQELSIDLGDKMTGRYGNKGVVCRIEPETMMPRTPWGDSVEIILNPLGVIGRMNVGQIYETYCGLISKSLAGMMSKNNKERFIHALKYVLPLLDGTKNKEYSKNLIDGLTTTTEEQYIKIVDKVKNDGFFPIVIPPFKSPSVQSIKKALDILGLNSGYHLYLPEFNINTVNEVPVGYLYMSKLEHIASLKVHSRSTGPLTSKTGQPTAGKRRGGGQRLGELDSYSILSYNVPHLASEILSSMSDDSKSKNEMISEIIQTGETKFRYPQVTPAKDLLGAFFVALMLDKRSMGE
jgi:DNA-directed RNA polymerase subunit beta